MIRRIDLRGAVPPEEGGVDYRDAVPRADFDVEAAVPAVHAICEDVRVRGLEAIFELSAKHDGVEQTDIRVPREALSRALGRPRPGHPRRARGVGPPAAADLPRPSSSATSPPTSGREPG